MPDAVEICASTGKLLLLVAGSLGFVVAGGALVLHTDIIGAIIGISSIVFFGACAVVGVWRLFTLRGPVVTLTPNGFRDVRIAPEIIEWCEVEDVSTWRHRGQKNMVLTVGEATWNRLSLSGIAQWTRSANRALGADGLVVSATELKTNHDRLLGLIMERWQAISKK